MKVPALVGMIRGSGRGRCFGFRTEVSPSILIFTSSAWRRKQNQDGSASILGNWSLDHCLLISPSELILPTTPTKASLRQGAGTKALLTASSRAGLSKLFLSRAKQ